MEITWHGYGCVSVKTKTATTIVDPYADSKGLRLPTLKGDIIVLTGCGEGNDNTKAVAPASAGSEPTVVDWPGEYEMKGVAITAQELPDKNGNFTLLIADGLKLCFIGNAKSELTEEMIDEIGDVDILFVPVGGGDAIDAKQAHKLVETIEPRAVVPVYYAVDGATEKLESAEAFLKASGAANAEPKEELDVKGRSSFREDAMEVVLLAPKLG